MAHGLATEDPAQADAAIRQAALDYWESWGEGNPDRVEQALHPDLAKRIVRPNDSPSHPWPPGDFLYELSAMRLVQLTDHEPIPVEERGAYEIVVLDRFEDIASVKIATSGGAEYLHLALWNGRWVVVNVLWGLLTGRRSEADDAAVPIERARPWPVVTAKRRARIWRDDLRPGGERRKRESRQPSTRQCRLPAHRQMERPVARRQRPVGSSAGGPPLVEPGAPQGRLPRAGYGAGKRYRTVGYERPETFHRQGSTWRR
jgi:hypothetical protein